MTRVYEFEPPREWRRLTGLEPDNEIWPGDDVAYEALLNRLAEYKKVVVLSGEVHYGAAGELTYWRRGLKRLTLDAAARGRSEHRSRSPRSPRNVCVTAFQQAGFNLSDITVRSGAEGNDEWIVADVRTEQMFLVRKENDGLNVYEEEEPARYRAVRLERAEERQGTDLPARAPPRLRVSR